MNDWLLRHRLWWKETRQLWPLVATLLGVGIFLELLFFVAFLVEGIEAQRGIVMRCLPALYAVGAGALLVGQEKEQRTMGWLVSLPITAGEIVRTKLLAAVIGLSFIWILAWPLPFFFGSQSPLLFGGPSVSQEQGLVWSLVHSLLILFAGFTTAWWLRSSLLGLLVLLPLACLPFVLASVHSWLLNSSAWGTLIISYSIVIGLVFLCAGWVAGLRCLRPQAAPKLATVGFKPGLAASIAPSLSQSRPRPSAALVWQFLNQNRWALLGLATLLIASAIALPSLVVPATLGGLISISWLGVLVFQSDTLDRRVMFLSDRGVSPWWVWCTRQLVPLGLLVLVILVVHFAVRSDWTQNWLWIGMPIGIYAVSQWVGQLVRSPIVAAVVTPLISAASIALAGFATWQLFAPTWVVAVSIALAFVATCIMTSAWMDERRGWRYWAGHMSLLTLAATLPLLPSLGYILTYPRLAADQRQELESIVESEVAYYRRYLSLAATPDVLQLPEGESEGESEAETPGDTGSSGAVVPLQSLAKARTRQIEHLQQRLDESSEKLIPDWLVLRNILPELLIQRMHLEQANTPERLKAYRDSVKLVADFAHNLRDDWQLLSQHQADMLEVWLLEELRNPNARELMGDDVHEVARGLLKDKASRDEARRRAIGLSWSESDDGQLGGYALLTIRNTALVSPLDMFVAKRNAGVISGLLLRLLDVDSEEQRKTIRSEMDRLMGWPKQAESQGGIYMDGPNGRQLLYEELQDSRTPGLLWNERWEREAAEL